jgi:NAD(P)-dependent dehydrogenase (short-subunit alcohol dehydrogenase family)
MESRSVLVTGANRGLGLEFVRQYAQAGWKTYAACRSPKSAKELKALQNQHAGRITVLSLDVTDAASIRTAAATLRGEPIDLLLNNAGVGSPPAQKIGSFDYAAWSRPSSRTSRRAATSASSRSPAAWAPSRTTRRVARTRIEARRRASTPR